MNIFFTRVDKAVIKFASLNQNDGAKTSRGQIFILYGNPNKIQNQMIDGKASEIWEYDKLQKIFIFVSDKYGDYKLKKIRDI